MAESFISAVLYSFKTRLIPKHGKLYTAYNNTVKEMLRVRIQTSKDLTLLVGDLPTVLAMVQARQKEFLDKITKWSHFCGSPLEFATNLAQRVGRVRGVEPY